MTGYPAEPRLDCDVIMKGGITSGVIYPRAVCELARTYRLRSVGGASAGAIAAAAAAAAEYGRTADGFEKLANLPDEISEPAAIGGSVLFRLFQPAGRTRGLFRVATAGLGKRKAIQVIAIALAVVRSFPIAVALGALPGIVLLILALFGTGIARVTAIVAAVLLLLVGATLGAAVGIAQRVGRAVPANNFGLCSGMPGPGSSGQAEALTPWLHKTVQDLAGRGTAGTPLTFGDLETHGCALRVMTTNLTRGQPLAMPWSDRQYFFDEKEFRDLFPADVVEWMVDHPPANAAEAPDSLRPLPAPEHLPVLVATRMSLSFPFLLSAIPLHTLDAAAPGGHRVHWFSDGGICSNLPVHFFDSPLPSRPTFAIDLAPFPPGREKSDVERENTFLPALDDSGRPPRWTTWPSTGLGSLVGFAGAMLSTARSWVDESQAAMPGYDDRIVTVYVEDDEGGLNLEMDQSQITGLAERGKAAAEQLVERFAGELPGTTPALGWERQRWLRFRTATAGLSGWLTGFRTGYTATPPATTPYGDLAGPGATETPPSHDFEPARRIAVDQRTGELLTLATDWAEPPADAFTEGAPEPAPVLQLVPKAWIERPGSPGGSGSPGPGLGGSA
ncbi:Patatin-like phospholipase [Amycolatopsis pretoriensis]|uniref:Patatin-like phospholipase n=1 Tax=Amycolatopsis pretoriensis TaxID=218821 RepID=A0A1H5RJD5_9PSEU|nr:patatin-like phospholipase family protein [Amycolatopsis pretoriensis]SEF37601.1 Patatin-like phospholipase [Amycolatopsis pretoriensis]